MGRLPVSSGADAVRIFGKAGWTVDRQRGSHVIPVKDGHIATLSVPDHKELARGTLRSLIRAAGMTAEDFEALAKDQALGLIVILDQQKRSSGTGKALRRAGSSAAGCCRWWRPATS